MKLVASGTINLDEETMKSPSLPPGVSPLAAFLLTGQHSPGQGHLQDPDKNAPPQVPCGGGGFHRLKRDH